MPKEDIFSKYCLYRKRIGRIDMVILNFLRKYLNFIKKKRYIFRTDKACTINVFAYGKFSQGELIVMSHLVNTCLNF